MAIFRHAIGSDSVEIEAPAHRVWEILVDVERYGEWNPFTTRVDTSLEVGSPVDLYVTLGPFKLRQPESIQDVVPPRLLAWGMVMGARWLLETRREQRLEPLSDSRCRYTTTDAFAGVLAPLAVLSFGGLIRRGFNAVAVALKERAEAEVHS